MKTLWTPNSSIYVLLLIVASLLAHPMSVGFHHFAHTCGDYLTGVL